MVAVMWLVEVYDAVGGDPDSAGIRPRDPDGLVGVPLSPFLHGSWGHLIGNTIPFVILGAAIAIGGLKRVAIVSVIVIVVGGLGTWLTRPSNTDPHRRQRHGVRVRRVPDRPRRLHPHRMAHHRRAGGDRRVRRDAGLRLRPDARACRGRAICSAPWAGSWPPGSSTAGVRPRPRGYGSPREEPRVDHRGRGLRARAGLRRLRRPGRSRRAHADRHRDAATAEATSTPTATASARGAKLRKIGDFDSPVFVTAPRGDRKVAVRGRAGRADHGRPQRAQALHAVPGHPRPGDLGRRAGPALDGLLARLRLERAVLRLLHRQATATSTSSSTSARAPTAPTRARRGPCSTWPTRSPTTTADCCCSGPAGTSTSAPATAAARGDQHGARGNAQNLGSLLGKILRIDPQGVRRRGRTRCRAATRSSAAAAPAARSTPTGCATRGASRSTAATATSRSATSARTRSRRSTSCATGAARTSAGAPFEGRSRYTPGESAPGAVEARHPALPQQGQLLDHRRRRGARPRRCAGSTAATCSATSAAGGSSRPG